MKYPESTGERPRKIRTLPAFDPVSTLIYRPRHLRFVTGLSNVTIWRMRQAGTFPAPLRLSEHAIGWPKTTIDEWLAAREAR
jgi:prophage regulatory protein